LRFIGDHLEAVAMVKSLMGIALLNVVSSFALASASSGVKQTDKVPDYYGVEQNVDCLEGYKCPEPSNKSKTSDSMQNSNAEIPGMHSREYFKISFVTLGLSPKLTISAQEKVKNVVIRFSQNNIKLDTKGLYIYISKGKINDNNFEFGYSSSTEIIVHISYNASEEQIESLLTKFISTTDQKLKNDNDISLLVSSENNNLINLNEIISTKNKIENALIKYSQNNIKLDTKGLRIIIMKGRIDHKTVFFQANRPSDKYVYISTQASDEDIEGILSVYIK
jgi:hypothetical protein